VSVSDSQFFFLQVVEAAPRLMQKFGDLETRLLQRRLKRIDIDRPIFIAGLARSGTTMLLELLAQHKSVATHRYRDFPFLMTPYLWNCFFGVFGGAGKQTERPHQDGIQITPESPEAFEEPIWSVYFPGSHHAEGSQVLGRDDRNEKFAAFFTDHVRKMLLIRGRTRYLSKGNYNVTRIEYLADLFPDARFVVPIRHPVPHVASLVRQHELFCDYSRRDGRVPAYLSAAGHYEFGPQRIPIAINGSGVQTLVAWQAAEEHRGYAIQWAAVYGFVLQLLEQRPELAKRVLVVRHARPRRSIRRYLQRPTRRNRQGLRTRRARRGGG
jgi:hypothetical protein